MNRGGYLVTGAAHCGWMPYAQEHLRRPTSAAGRLAGGPVEGWFAPRLDNAERSGLKSWSVDDIVDTCRAAATAKATPTGRWRVVVNSTSNMSDADIRAIAVYLKDLRWVRRSPR